MGDGGLRVSLYLRETKHARLSVWHGDEAEAAISLDPDEIGAGSAASSSPRRTQTGTASLVSPRALAPVAHYALRA